MEIDKMELFDQNVKIHIGTYGLDAAIKKVEQLLALLKKAQRVAVPQDTK